MCSLHLTHPSVHTWSSGQPTVQRPGSSHGLPVGAGIQTHKSNALSIRPTTAQFDLLRNLIFSSLGLGSTYNRTRGGYKTDEAFKYTTVLKFVFSKDCCVFFLQKIPRRAS